MPEIFPDLLLSASSFMRLSAAALAALLFFLTVTTARADSRDDAKAHYRKGLVHFNLNEWKEAAVEFKEAYRLQQDASFLYNLGQCYRKMGDSGEALSFYKKYLRAAPDAKNRKEVERRIEELELAIAAKTKAIEAPPTEPMPAPVAVGSAPSLPTAPAPTATRAPLSIAPPLPEPSSGATLSATGESDRAREESPIYTRWWFWSTVGAAVAAGVAIGLVAGGGGTRPVYSGDLQPGQIPIEGNRR
jgi:hypothetical protein